MVGRYLAGLHRQRYRPATDMADDIIDTPFDFEAT